MRLFIWKLTVDNGYVHIPKKKKKKKKKKKEKKEKKKKKKKKKRKTYVSSSRKLLPPFTGVYIIFLISAQNIDCGYSLDPPRRI